MYARVGPKLKPLKTKLKNGYLKLYKRPEEGSLSQSWELILTMDLKFIKATFFGFVKKIKSPLPALDHIERMITAL